MKSFLDNMNDKEKEIRRLLDLYYEGETDREQERRLTELLASSAELPADLEADRQLFLSLSEDPEAEIPAEVDGRVLVAIEREISRERRAAYRRVGWWTAASVAASLLIAWLAIKSLHPAHDPAVPAPGHEVTAVADDVENTDTPVLKSDTAMSQTGLATVTEKEIRSHETPEAPVLKQSDSNDSKTSKKSLRKEVKKPKVAEAPEASEDSYYLTAEEERQLEVDNYRVVSDEREAYAIINSVFSRLDGNVRESNYRIGDISEQYHRVATKF